MVAPCLVACGEDGGSGDGDGPPPAYYRQLADITAEVDAANTAADRALNDAVATTDPAELGTLFSDATLASAPAPPPGLQTAEGAFRSPAPRQADPASRGARSSAG